MRNFSLTQAARDAVYLCIACGANGVVRATVTPDPFGSIRRRSNVAAAMWAWVGSESKAKLVVRQLRRRWGPRLVPGEGYRFDYGDDGSDFRAELNAAFTNAVGKDPVWEKLGPRR